MHLPFKNIYLLASTLSVGIAISIAAPTNAQILNSGSITAEATGLKNAAGQICFSLFDSSQGFPNNPEAIVETQCISAVAIADEDTEAAPATETASTNSVTFENLALGTYAISVIHDEDKDNQLSTGSFGIPTEGFGFSQNPAISTGAPEFNEAAIVVVSRDTVTQIELIYY